MINYTNPNNNPLCLDFGIKFKKPKPVRKAPDDFLTQHFDELTATKINFVPMMLQSLVLSAAVELADRLRDTRIEKLKKHTRLLRDTIRKCELTDWQKHGAQGVAEYKKYTDRYADLVSTQCWLFIKNLEEQAMNALPEKDRSICAYVTYVALIATFARSYELSMNEMISKVSGEHVSKAPDMFVTIVHAICVDIAEEYGYQLTVDNDAKLWAKILSQKAFDLAEVIYKEENQ